MHKAPEIEMKGSIKKGPEFLINTNTFNINNK